MTWKLDDFQHSINLFATFVQTFVYFVVKLRLSLTTKYTKVFSKVTKGRCLRDAFNACFQT
jgi:hypothetical protein